MMLFVFSAIIIFGLSVGGIATAHQGIDVEKALAEILELELLEKELLQESIELENKKISLKNTKNQLELEIAELEAILFDLMLEQIQKENRVLD